MQPGRFVGRRAYFDELGVRDKVFNQDQLLDVFNGHVDDIAHSNNTLTESGVYTVSRAGATNVKLTMRTGNRYTIINTVNRTHTLTIEGTAGSETVRGIVFNNGAATEVTGTHTQITMDASGVSGDLIDIVIGGNHIVIISAQAAAASTIASAA